LDAARPLGRPVLIVFGLIIFGLIVLGTEIDPGSMIVKADLCVK
jgi:hypothetical protein